MERSTVFRKYQDIRDVRADIEDGGTEYGNVFIEYLTGHKSNIRDINECIFTAQYLVEMVHNDIEVGNMFKVANAKAKKLVKAFPHFKLIDKVALAEERALEREHRTLKFAIKESHRRLVEKSDPPMDRFDFVKYVEDEFGISRTSAHAWTYLAENDLIESIYEL